jgi:protein-disulfide isomerase-like protein with CxxC motif
MSLVQVTYGTDPLCAWFWAPQPAARNLLEEFAGEVRSPT